jgi:hypothetical protein
LEKIQSVEQSIGKVANAVTRRRFVRHIFWWLLFYAFLVFIEHTTFRQSLKSVLWTELLSIGFYVSIYYVVAEFLIPNYLAKNRFWAFLFLTLLFAILVTPIRDFVHYLRFSGNENMKEIVKANQLFSYFVSVFWAGFFTILKILSDWATQSRRQRELETRNIQTELNLLKSQINPHFLFNTLNSLYALTLKKSDDAPEIVLKLSEMMRYILYECNEPRVDLEKEIRYLQNYLDLEKMRLGSKMDVKLDIEGDYEGLRISPLLMLPFVENAFKHGASNSIRAGYVYLHLLITDNELNLHVENTKAEQPLVRDPNRRSGGIGLANVKRRLSILYPEKHQLEITDESDVYSVNFWLDLK